MKVIDGTLHSIKDNGQREGTAMEQLKKLKRVLRKYIGLRTIKTVVAVALSFVVYELRGRQGIPFYSALSAIWCIRPDIGNSRNMAWQRTQGTLIGACYGLLVLLIENNLFNGMDEVTGYLLSSFLLVPVIITTVIMKRKDSSYFSCAVYLSITINHMRDANPYLFVWNRICDTMIGIIIALVVNTVRIPYRKNQGVLYVSGLDEVLLTGNDRISDYAKRELNRMLDDGMYFTIATMRTPASLIAPLRELHINLPIIAMDGAVLFDMKQNSFLKTVTIDAAAAEQTASYLDRHGLHYFMNLVVEDTVFIYYGELEQEKEKQLVQRMRVSPYRNYLQGYPGEYDHVIYLMLLLEDSAADKLAAELSIQPFASDIRQTCAPASDCLGYSYLRIYSADSSRQNMAEYLMQQVGAARCLSIGSIPDQCDICTDGTDTDEVVRVIRSYYEPYFWKRQEPV